MKIAVITLACVLGAVATARAVEAPRPPIGPPAPMALTQPETTKPEATKPEATKPEATKPEATKPGATKSETTKSADEAKPGKTDLSSQMGRGESQALHGEGQAKPHLDAARRPEAPRGRVCFNPAETREKIAMYHLAEPFRALRAGRLQGEALRARLCRWKPDEFVYEVSVLRSNGRIAHVYMNAQNGQAVGAVLADPDRN